MIDSHQRQKTSWYPTCDKRDDVMTEQLKKRDEELLIENLRGRREHELRRYFGQRDKTT